MGHIVLQNSRHRPWRTEIHSSYQIWNVEQNIYIERQHRRKIIYCGIWCLCAHDQVDGIDSRRSGNRQSVSTSTTVITAIWLIDTTEEATIYVKELDTFVTVQLLEDSPVVLHLGKLCDENGYSYECWNESQSPNLFRHGKMKKLQVRQLRACRCSWSIK